MKLQTLYLASPREALIKKKSFESKTLKFFIIYSFFLQELAFQALVFQALVSALNLTSHLSIQFLSTVFTCLSYYIIFEKYFKLS